ncbi:MAG TPA: PA2779 family protein [Terracidiphilus sp.]|jgi:hypothetical protein|nr:PA2779 family protein [Terracidiphilus sp.]
MLSERFRIVRALTAAALAALFAMPPSTFAQANQLVSPSELQQAAVGASQQREQNIAALHAFFGSDQARQALESAHMNPAQVDKAVASLSSGELAQLAARANKGQADFAAGDFSNRDLLILVVAIAVIVLVIVAVR